MKKYILIASLAGLFLANTSLSAESTTPPRSIRILAIGNSFSVDGLEHAYSIATNAGIQEVTLGNLVIGGCSLERHWRSAKADITDYNYRKNTSGTWIDRRNSTMEYGLLDEPWDIITIQQVSHCSGLPETYNADLDHLITYINSRKTNPDAKLGWQMIWAYQQDSSHGGFAKYDKDQMTMYNAIVTAVTKKIAPNKAFDFIIPSGTAIQNMRTSYIGDTLTRDGFHMSLNLGRYIVGMTWVKTLTGASIEEVSWVPDATEVPKTLLPVIKEAVNNAIQTPFAITESSYTEKQ
ncbi:DUF4886 domain-containing protein [Tichowtungia aerotolerans]|uniref:DUF4886 domain-containing protein n=1 Tax=Tichowtungia aerotolerans TaxID=2697043 RepID=A0A6P1M9Z5_9BACT|nr:DUF4886 domain-containing protein [Tichowtungia aerotolerans]QHI69374.1 DUF4886 domain-containing protein [Tichowtungia aerotolerans]